MGAISPRSARSATRRWCWATNANTPYKSIADVLAAAKAQPGRISVGSPGNGSINQIVIEWMALNTGTQFQHIPYKGGAPAAAALAGGDIPFGVLASSSAAPQVKAGRAARAGGDRRAAVEVQSGMADPAVAGRQGRRCLELDAAAGAQGHAEGDRRQASGRGGENPRHARREGALRRRRRRDDSVHRRPNSTPRSRRRRSSCS